MSDDLRQVYIMKCLGVYKIGWTSDIFNRLNEIRKCNPYPVTLIHLFISEKPKTAETELHKRFRDKHIHDEWYDLSEEDVCSIKDNS